MFGEYFPTSRDQARSWYLKIFDPENSLVLCNQTTCLSFGGSLYHWFFCFVLMLLLHCVSADSTRSNICISHVFYHSSWCNWKIGKERHKTPSLLVRQRYPNRCFIKSYYQITGRSSLCRNTDLGGATTTIKISPIYEMELQKRPHDHIFLSYFTYGELQNAVPIVLRIFSTWRPRI